MKKKILCFFGTRPEAIKMAPVVEELRKSKRLTVSVVVSAQHRDLLDQVLSLFGVRSLIDLNLMKKGQTLTDITTGVLNKFGPILDRLKPDLTLVHGDTTTAMAGALASFYRQIPVGHVEAGLRTNDLARPFPEEMNRRVVDVLTDFYFSPTSVSSKRLIEEGKSPKKIFQTGNTVIDALLEARTRVKKPTDPALDRILKSKNRRRVLITAHRRENFGKPFERIFKAIKELAALFPDVDWIYPVHPNPNVMRPARRILGKSKNIYLLKPLSYGDLVFLMDQSAFVLTDSGGLQEEAPSFGKPVLVLREVTERPEAVKAGTVRLVGSDPKKIIGMGSRLLTQKKFYDQMARAINPYGDGRAARRIRQAIESRYFGVPGPKAFRAVKRRKK